MRMVNSRNPFFLPVLLLTPRYFLCHVCVFIWVPACACLKWGSLSSPYLSSLLDTRFLVLLTCSVSPLISAACGVQEVWLGQVWPNKSIWNETCPLNFGVRCLWGMSDVWYNCCVCESKYTFGCERERRNEGAFVRVGIFSVISKSSAYTHWCVWSLVAEWSSFSFLSQPPACPISLSWCCCLLHISTTGRSADTDAPVVSPYMYMHIRKYANMYIYMYTYIHTCTTYMYIYVNTCIHVYTTTGGSAMIHMYICICIHICMYIHKHVYMYTYTYIHSNIHVYNDIYIHVCIYIWMYVYICRCIYIYMYMFIYMSFMYTYTYMYTYIYVYDDIYVHLYI